MPTLLWTVRTTGHETCLSPGYLIYGRSAVLRRVTMPLGSHPVPVSLYLLYATGVISCYCWLIDDDIHMRRLVATYVSQFGSGS